MLNLVQGFPTFFSQCPPKSKNVKVAPHKSRHIMFLTKEDLNQTNWRPPASLLRPPRAVVLNLLCFAEPFWPPKNFAEPFGLQKKFEEPLWLPNKVGGCQKKFTESICCLNTVWELSVFRKKSLLAIELKYLAEPWGSAEPRLRNTAGLGRWVPQFGNPWSSAQGHFFFSRKSFQLPANIHLKSSVQKITI